MSNRSPGTPERRKELLRQRLLIEEHLAWLNRELLEAGGETAEASPSIPVPGTAASDPGRKLLPSTPPATKDTREADTILAEYHQAPENLQANVKRGCLLYFAAAMALLLLGVSLVYVFSKHQRRSPDKAPPALESR